ncbi:MAG: hypothetical protein RL190_250 [Actinomycetota bacterium]|jgi:uncharacterized cupin superfamily protein
MAPNAPHFDDPLTLALDVIGPKPNATRGEPVESGKVLFADAHSESGVWECTAGAFAARREGYRETFAVIRGRGVLRNEDGTETQLAPGVLVVTPEGWVGEWDIEETVRKVYVVSYTEPRAS